MNNAELIEKLQQGLNDLENEWLGDSTGDEVSEEGAELGAYSEAIERFQELINNIKTL
jgi:hypothetical protein